jgi:hypothetical protein
MYVSLEALNAWLLEVAPDQVAAARAFSAANRPPARRSNVPVASDSTLIRVGRNSHPLEMRLIEIQMELWSKPIGSDVLDRLEQEVRDRLEMWERLLEDKVKARAALLKTAANERDRAIYEILIKQRASANGNRSGNRRGVVTNLKDYLLLNNYRRWQEGRNRPGSDREFASWWHKQETKKDATEQDIKRLTKRLRDARQRVEHQ